MKAVERYDPDKGYRLISYAICGSGRIYRTTLSARGPW
jgi:DNA-directed RNA polymerase specialized sigma subunit